MSKLAPIHPGEHVKAGLEELDMSNADAARILECSRAYIGDIVKGKRDLSVDMCFRLSAFLGSSPDFWMNLQAHYDIQSAQNRPEIIQAMKKIRRNATHAHALS